MALVQHVSSICWVADSELDGKDVSQEIGAYKMISYQEIEGLPSKSK